MPLDMEKALDNMERVAKHISDNGKSLSVYIYLIGRKQYSPSTTDNFVIAEEQARKHDRNPYHLTDAQEKRISRRARPIIQALWAGKRIDDAEALKRIGGYMERAIKDNFEKDRNYDGKSMPPPTDEWRERKRRGIKRKGKKKREKQQDKTMIGNGRLKNSTKHRVKEDG